MLQKKKKPGKKCNGNVNIEVYFKILIHCKFINKHMRRFSGFTQNRANFFNSTLMIIATQRNKKT